MAVPLLVAGAVLQIVGKYGANLAQAEAELQNAKFYAKQRDLAITAYGANLLKESVQYNYQRGRIASAFAGGGADVGSGSSSLHMASLAARNIASVAQIKEAAMVDIELAGHRARRSEETAGTLSSPGYNALQGGATALTAYAEYKDRQQGVLTNGFRGNITIPDVYSTPAPQPATYYSNYLTGSSGGYQGK